MATEASFSILKTLSPVLAGAGILRAGELVEILIPGKGLKSNTYTKKNLTHLILVLTIVNYRSSVSVVN